MKSILKIISLIGLLLTLVPSFLVFARIIDIDQHKNYMFAGTFLWFATAPFWLGQKAQQSSNQS